MPQDQNAKAARARLDTVVVLSIQITGLAAAVRAILATHPEPDRVRAVFDQLFDQWLGQMLAHPGFLAEQDKGVVLRDFAASLFQPPVVL